MPNWLGDVISRIPLPRPTVRLRLTLTYAGLFILSGATALAINYSVLRLPGIIHIPDLPAAGEVRATPGRGADTRPPIRLILPGEAIALALMAGPALGLGWVVAGRVLRPLRTITATTRRISDRNLNERIAMRGPDDELRELADTIDGLLGRLEEAFGAQRRFVANASHELRTPLAMIRTSVDVATAKPDPRPPEVTILANKVRRGLDRAEHLLENLLVLAQAQHGSVPCPVIVALDRVAAAALEERAEAIASRGLMVRRELCAAPISGNEVLISRMVANVIDNAVRHNQPRGWVRVMTRWDGATAELVVESGGRLLTEREVEALGQPFRRLGAARTGSGNGFGLGLSIVAAIAAAHSGALHLQARSEGGLLVTIVLPVAGASG
ncbi:MAG TPA: HAMP domain-containing sensor histidine kinase [Candidatus Dormibacteraeota bacterium]